MQIAFIGLGEAASAFISGWGVARSGQIAAYDIKSLTPETAPEIAARAEKLGIRNCTSLEDALHSADIVFSTVTADQAVIAAKTSAPLIGQGTFWCDLNSCAPASKQTSEAVINQGGGRYVDVAVMAPVHPALNLVPCLISGPYAIAVEAILKDLPMKFRIVEGSVGRASSIKMVRSIMVKGLEALTAECTLAAVAAGVEDEVLPTLKDGHPKLDIAARAAYNYERSIRHGVRRAAEMDEVAKMLTDLGLPNSLSTAAADWQRALATSGSDLSGFSEADDYRWYATKILEKIRKT